VSDDRSGVEMKLLEDHDTFATGPNAQRDVHIDLRRHILNSVVPDNYLDIKRELVRDPTKE
jgi:hypothetical protein